MRTIPTLIVLLALAAAARADVRTFRQDVDGYAGNRDTELRMPEPYLNSGGAGEVSIDADDGPGSYNPTHGLLAFDNLIGNGPNQIPAGATINSATLRLIITSEGSGWNWHRMLVNWDENAATWNSFVGGVQADGVEALSAPTFSDGANNGSGNVSNDPYFVTLTADVQAWANGAANYGWAILPFEPLGTNGIDFPSSEYSAIDDRPLLTVDYTVPEPASLALLALGGLLIARRRSA